ncbi:MAG: putative ABC transporter permease [Defluviitaleaceae bacterium]|nr:putative ABC transporter permease [Defluviitaleaceae bacterium]
MGLHIALRFLIYGAFGWTLEVIWTGLSSLIKGDYTMRASTSIWMFFIYGLFVFFEPAFAHLAGLPIVARGIVYMLAIFFGEYVTGRIMNKAEICPWDYSHTRYHVQGVIRLDYAPAWFAAGLLFEAVYFIIR